MVQTDEAKGKIAKMLEGRSVLVVEPSENFRTSIRRFLHNLDVKNVKTIATIREAKQIIKEIDQSNPVGLVIAEWVGKSSADNGLQFCRELRRDDQYRDLPVLLLSSENQRSDVSLACEVGVDRYLLKPFKYEDFVNQMYIIAKQVVDPSPLKSLLDRGAAAVLDRKYKKAEVYFKDAIELEPKSARAICGMARVNIGQKKFREALEYLKQANKINCEYIEAYRLAYHVHETTGNKKGQFESMLQLYYLSPDNPKYNLVLARMYIEQDDLVRAERHFRKCLQLSPKMASAYRGLGDVAMLQEKFPKAERSYKKSLDIDGDDISTLNSLGLTYVKMGQIEQGINMYLLALKLEPKNVKILFNLGYAEEKRKSFLMAGKYYKQALGIDAGYTKAKKGLERLLSLHGFQASA